MRTHFKIIIPTYNAEEFIENALISVLNQDYDDFECIITDDCSSDDTAKLIQDFISDNAAEDYFIFHQNTERKLALYNLHSMIQDMDAEDEDVVVMLDGDDWFSNNEVLSRLDQIYQEDKCWLTYGSYVQYPDGRNSSFHVSEYSDEILKSGDFKKDPQWRASHLRTFKYKLARRLTKEDLSDEDGNYYEMTWDQAMMYPMMEMARERVKFVSDVLYVYNDANPINDHKGRSTKTN